MTSQRCKCGMPLIYDSEFDFGICIDCQGAAAERYLRRADWDEFHPGEPCPSVELEQ